MFIRPTALNWIPVLPNGLLPIADTTTQKSLPWQCKYSTTITYLWNCRNISTTTIWRTHDNECSHDLMRVAHKVSDHQFITNSSDKLPMTTHWLHQLTKMGVGKYAIIHPKFGQDHYTKSVSSVSVASSVWWETQSSCWLALKRHIKW